MHGEYRDGRIAEGMAEHDALLGEAFGAAGADVVAIEDLEHARAGETRDEGGGKGGEGDCRAGPGDVQPAKPEVGSQRSATPKSRMSMMPSQKFGSD